MGAHGAFACMRTAVHARLSISYLGLGYWIHLVQLCPGEAERHRGSQRASLRTLTDTREAYGADARGRTRAAAGKSSKLLSLSLAMKKKSTLWVSSEVACPRRCVRARDRGVSRSGYFCTCSLSQTLPQLPVLHQQLFFQWCLSTSFGKQQVRQSRDVAPRPRSACGGHRVKTDAYGAQFRMGQREVCL